MSILKILISFHTAVPGHNCAHTDLSSASDVSVGIKNITNITNITNIEETQRFSFITRVLLFVPPAPGSSQAVWRSREKRDAILISCCKPKSTICTALANKHSKLICSCSRALACHTVSSSAMLFNSILFFEMLDILHVAKGQICTVHSQLSLWKANTFYHLLHS